MSPSRTIGLALFFTALAPFSIAEADNRIRTSSTRLDDEMFELRIEASEDIGEPRVRTSPGFVRVWFPAMDAPILNTDSDGRSVRFVRIRPGYEDTAIAVIRLGDMRTLEPNAVVVTREGNVARIRVSRSALPPPVLATPAEIAAPEALADAHASAELEEVAEAGSPEGSADAADVEAEPTTVPSEASPESVEEPLAALSTRSTTALPIPNSSGPSTLVMMLILTLLLGSAYLMVRLFGKYYGKRAGVNPDIEIIATKRLGNRHQLLVVRALGEDYLLSVNGGHTERIASSPTPLLSLNTESAEDSSEPESELLPRLLLGRDDQEGGSRRNRSVARKRIEVRPRFGAELLKAAGDRTRSDRVSLSSSQAPASDAVAGLLRLRQKLGR